MKPAHFITGVISPATHSEQRTASIHAGYTGLTGLTQVARVCVRECIAMRHSIYVCQVANTEFLSCANNSMLTLLTLIKASIHAGLKSTGLTYRAVSPCKGVVS